MNEFYLKSIYLENYRNIKNCDLTFSKNINCLFGKNGNGKTNLLEAIFYSAFKKSFRKNVNKEQIIKSEIDHFIIKSDFQCDDKEINHAFKVSKEDSLIYVNKKKTNKLSKAYIVSINPHDSFLYHHQSSYRRNLLNHLITTFDENYGKSLKIFEKTLRMRNSLITKYQGPRENLLRQILALDEILAKEGLVLLRARENFCKKINTIIERIFNEIFNEPLKINLEYESEFKNMDSEEEIYNYYQGRVEKDLIRKGTKKGLHLDDYLIFIDEKPAETYGSVGQQKVSYLSLLFAYVEYLENELKIPPIILLDDISGELDSRCWKNLLNYLDKKLLQVFISTANDSFGEDLENFRESKKFNVVAGSISER